MKHKFMIGRRRLPLLALASLMSCGVCLATACGSDEGDSEASDGGSSSPDDTTAGSGDTGAETGGTGAASGAAAATGGASAVTGGSTATGGATSPGGATGASGATATGGAAGAGGATGEAYTDDDCRVWMDPNGTDAEGCGAADNPCASLVAAYNVVCPVPPEGTENGTECLGEAPRTLCIREGTYMVTERFELRKTRMGTESNPIILMGAPSATTKPVLDFSTQPRVAACGAQSDSTGGELTGITMNADWTVLRNVVVADANDNCVKVMGANNLVENVVVHDCDDAGIQISAGSGYVNSGTNNTILNCDSYQNYDEQCMGRNADGFAVKTGTGASNVFRGCRAWDNADDGWDLGGWTNQVRVENCWAINQCATVSGDYSDCNGFMFGDNEVEGQHVLIDLIAVGNRGGLSGFGFTKATNPAPLTCEGTCAAWDNDTDVDPAAVVDGVSTAPIGTVTAEQMISAERGADGSLPDINSL